MRRRTIRRAKMQEGECVGDETAKEELGVSIKEWNGMKRRRVRRKEIRREKLVERSSEGTY